MTYTITINFFIEATSPTLVQLFNNTSLFYLFILLLKLCPENIEKTLKESIFYVNKTRLNSLLLRSLRL